MDDEPEFADEQGERQGFNIERHFNIDIIIGKAVISVFPPLKHNTKHIHNQNSHVPLTQNKGPVPLATLADTWKNLGVFHTTTTPNYCKSQHPNLSWSSGVGLAI